MFSRHSETNIKVHRCDLVFADEANLQPVKPDEHNTLESKHFTPAPLEQHSFEQPFDVRQSQTDSERFIIVIICWTYAPYGVARS